MAELPPEELGREIDRLWAKVAASSGSSEAPPAMPPHAEAPVGELAWETLSLLKRRHRHESRGWSEMMEAKEHALRVSRERETALTLEMKALRDQLENEQGRLVEESLEIEARLSALQRSLEEERVSRASEERSLRALLEQTRSRMAAEEARWRVEREQWEKKEHQFLLDLKELQTLSARYQEEAGKAGSEARRMADGLGEAKNAIEKTLSELLRERQVREAAETERNDALKKVDATQKHLEELSRIWDEERAQWRELWDRERSTWESQRAEFASWEESLRRERETWNAELAAKEKDQARFSDELTKSLRENAEIAVRLKNLAVPAVLSRPLVSWRVALGAFVAVAFAVVVLPWTWRHFNSLQFKQQSARGVALANPTALGFDGTLLWAADWDGQFSAINPVDLSVLRGASVAPGGSYRPIALAFGAGQLWSADAAQARIIRHSAENPSLVLAARPSPGPAPTALAYDGRALWSYDAANRALYRHGADEASFKSYALTDAVPTAMAWVADELWLHDAKSRKLLVYSFADEVLRRRSESRLDENVIGLAASYGAEKSARRLWVLAGAGPERPGPAIVRYAY